MVKTESMGKYSPLDHVTILLATYNGAQYLSEQLESIRSQSHKNWHILASDDGSTDATYDILRSFSKSCPLEILQGPKQGYVRNFLHLLSTHFNDGGAVAFCDQDDVWLPEKLEVALQYLSKVPKNQPALYCNRRIIWESQHNTQRSTKAYLRRPSFENALTENIAPGNTIVLNGAAAELARQLAPTAGRVFAHDWWLYLLVSGAGGAVFYDPDPHILYRQHAGNVIGAGEKFGQNLQNKIGVWKGVFKKRLHENVKAMQEISQYLTVENQLCLSLFSQALQAPIHERLTLLHRSGIYRQGRVSGFTFWSAACLGKL